MKIARRRLLAATLAAGALVVLCFVLAVVQYRWIGEVGEAARYRLRSGLTASLNRVAADFDREVSTVGASLTATTAEVEAMGRETAYAQRYSHWRAWTEHPGLILRLGLVIPDGDLLRLELLDMAAGTFAVSEWPGNWQPMRERIERIRWRGPSGPPRLAGAAIFELPRFGEGGEQEWLILELDLGYLRSQLFPELLRRHLPDDGEGGYDAEIVAGTGEVIYRSGAPLGGDAELRAGIFRRPAPGPRPAGEQPAEWSLAVRHRSGSLEHLAARARRWNLAVAGMLLLLTLGAAAMVIQHSRAAQQLAETQMSFVAGVSHELRTPLTVIRTAAHNLQGRLSSQPAQVERYGRLIQSESERLTGIVEQVLSFASMEAGRVIGARAPVAVEPLLEDGIRAIQRADGRRRVEVECDVAPDLPLVLADEAALKRALRNLIDNAWKHGSSGDGWVKVSARVLPDNEGGGVEIRVADRGPGIPAAERERIWEPFYRGENALRDQVQGTGLGLALVKKIVEAHGGTIRVVSGPSPGAEFVVRLPGAPPELQDEFAHSTG